MNTPESTLDLVVTRTMDAPAERVFDAWLDSANVGRWLFATPSGQMVHVEIDPRVGGKFTITEKRGESLADHFGTYLEIDRPGRLVFSFATEREQKPTVVTVEIVPVASGCKVTLTHRVEAQWANYLDRIRAGWTAIVDGLASTVAPRQ